MMHLAPGKESVTGTHCRSLLSWPLVGAWFLACLLHFLSTADAADLAPLRRAIDTAAADTGKTRDRAARLLGVVAQDVSTPDDVGTPTIEAARRVVVLGDRVIGRSEALVDILASKEKKRPISAEQLDAALAAFGAARRKVTSSGATLRAQMDLLASAGPPPFPAMEEQRFVEAVSPYVADADALLAQIEAVAKLLLFKWRKSDRPIKAHVYQFIDDNSASVAGYGLYTHVILQQSSDRGRKLLKAIQDSVVLTNDAARRNKERVNLFGFPVKDRGDAEFAEEIAASNKDLLDPEIYDYQAAAGLLTAICLGSGDEGPSHCSGHGQNGPYLLTHGTWLIGADQVGPPFLLVDLSTVHEDAFGAIVPAVRKHVMLADFDINQKIDLFYLELLSVTLGAADLLVLVRDGITEIISIGGKRR